MKEVSSSLVKLQKLVNEVQQTAKNAKNVAVRLSNHLDKTTTSKWSPSGELGSDDG